MTARQILHKGLIKRLTSIYLSLFIFLLCLPLVASAEVREYRLDNGLKVLIAEDHKAPVATFQIWYRVGSRNEPAGKTGISHLLEHMMFKGTPEYGSKVFSRLVQKNGGIDNAYTTKDYTAYFQILASDRIDLSVSLESDRMENLLLAPDDVRDERSVVMEERRMRYEDDPQSSLYEEVVATAIKVHPYHHPVIGWMSEIASINQQDLLQYYKKFYSPDNAVIIVAGDVNADELIEKIRERFGRIPEGPQREPVTSKEPPQKGQKRVYLKKEARLPYILTAYHVPGFPQEDSAALDVLSSILSGKSGRLYKNLVRDKKVALNAYASYSGLYMDPFLFFFGGTAPPGKDIDALEKAFYEEIDRLKNTLPSEREVQKARNQVEAAFIMGQDSISFQARVLGMFEMLGDWKLKDRYLKTIREVTPEDVQEVAKKYFTEENRTVGILIPEGG
ncbi:hypothetical protein MNBD_NITROSPIRAE02-155 [hydrothermal vent metagenome]|uniref:Zinc protease n=1 Tax=hydrothermal vent metagenome TaxID=652676 RepID=A0A3B1DAY7_9ZZZZ